MNLIEEGGQQHITRADKPKMSSSPADNNKEIVEVRCRVTAETGQSRSGSVEIDSGADQWGKKRDPGLDDDRGY